MVSYLLLGAVLRCLPGQLEAGQPAGGALCLRIASAAAAGSFLRLHKILAHTVNKAHVFNRLK